MPQPPERPHDVQHLVVPWAASLSEACQQALPALDAPQSLPHLRQLMRHLSQHDWLKGDEYDPTPPHERWLSHAMGGQGAPAPWAAIQARTDGLAPEAGQAWGLMTPCHWLMGHDHLTLLHPDELHLSDEDSHTLLDAIRPLFEDEGWALHWGHATRWYVVHPTLADLPTASLDRLVGRNPDLWMPEHPQARLLKRLQAEVQMLLYQHPLNDARQEAGAFTVNSFWLSGCGLVPEAPQTSTPSQHAAPAAWTVADGLRPALLRGDVPAWAQAWQTLDQGPLRQLAQAAAQGQRVRLTLCGERHALTLGPAPDAGWLHRSLGPLQRLIQPSNVSPSDLLRQL